ncbi:MAG: HAD family hydrolase [Oscillospiraceae bacterium]
MIEITESTLNSDKPYIERRNFLEDWRGGISLKTLYISDLDGTLLRSDETISEYTSDVINRITDRGILFSYATARSLITAKKVTGAIKAQIPLITYNGTFIFDNVTEEIIAANFFDHSVVDLLEDLFANQVYPIVYAFVDGKEKFSFLPELCTRGMNTFLDSRKGDVRTNSVMTIDDLKKGDIFYITCIDSPEKLQPLYEKYNESYHCVYQKDIYSKEQWLEFLPRGASKANAVKQLKTMMKCDRVVVFGDGKNNIDMFEQADEAYAVQNAHEDLKKYATAIIQSNDDDGVAKWLERNVI